MAKTRKKLAARPPALPKMIGSEWANRKACERKRGFDLKVKAVGDLHIDQHHTHTLLN